MNYRTRSTVFFDAGHTVNNEVCGDKPHGHRYTVTVTWAREGYPATDLELWWTDARKLEDLRKELNHRELNRMLGASEPNVFGVAGFFMERLAAVSNVIKVEVNESDGPTAIVERDITT